MTIKEAWRKFWRYMKTRKCRRAGHKFCTLDGPLSYNCPTCVSEIARERCIMKLYALQYTDEVNNGALVGIDKSSGGYPYPIKDELIGAWVLPVTEKNLARMRDYNATNSNQFTLVYVETKVTPVP